jgi:lysophospholipase L1-like esterase
MPHTRSLLTSLIAAVLLAGGASSYAQSLGANAQPVVFQAGGAAPAATTAAVGSPEKASDYGRWQASFEAFAAADKASQPAQHGTLFVGSSTIRMWTSMAQDFRQLPVVINRGFGGSTMADCNKYVRDLVIRYQPDQVLVYAGDNDLAEGHTPQQVLASFTSFVKAVRAELPQARIDNNSIKPSPSRANAGYIDIHTPMLAADGQPRGDLFLGDRLHLNETGYRLWQSIISARLTAAPRAVAATPGAAPSTAAPQMAKLP